MASPFILLLQPRLFENAVQCARRKVDVGLPCNRDGSGLGWVMELTVAPRNSDLRPSVRFQRRDHGLDLHAAHATRDECRIGSREYLRCSPGLLYRVAI